MPTPSQTFTTEQELLNFINTFIVTNGVEAITGDLHNSVENGLLQLNLRSILNYTGAQIFSSGGSILLAKSFNLITGTPPDDLRWSDSFFLKEFYIANTTSSDIDLYSGFYYYDVFGAQKNTIPANTTIHIARALNGSWINFYNAVGEVVVVNPLVITLQPQSQTVNEGQSVTFTVTAAGGNLPYTYQWQMLSGITWVNISGATSSSLNLTNVDTSDEGSFRVIVGGGLESVTSDAAELTVVAAAETFVAKLYWGSEDPTPIQEGDGDVVYQLSQTFATGSDVSFALPSDLPANVWFSMEEPAAQPLKTIWYVTPFNNGGIPDGQFLDAVEIGSLRKYNSRTEITLDAGLTLSFKIS